MSNSQQLQTTGAFEVVLNPLDPYASGTNEMNIGRMSIEKKFQGGIEGSSRGEMLSVRTPTEGSAGYVALEQVTGAIDGRTGSFVLQHFGVMSKEQHRLTLEVVPDSGTGELTGLSGTMTIDAKNGDHSYQFTYALD